jgi:putative zinc finger/helix-turn-helix YgiT family protein
VRPATVRYSTRIKHDGRLYEVDVPKLRVPRCADCGELVFDNDADEQIAQALREQLGLLAADQIRNNREALRLTQRELADQLAVAVETISRWETGALTQSRSMDRYLRVYFGIPAVRTALAQPSALSALGTHVEDVSG